MTQLMMTKTAMTMTPRMASRIVPAGGLSNGDDELECCGDDMVGV